MSPFSTRKRSPRSPRSAASRTGPVLGGPTVLAFFSGGYFEGPSLWAGIAAWTLAAVAALAAPHPLPRSASGRLAILGMALLTAWTVASIAWAPVGHEAYGDAE